MTATVFLEAVRKCFKKYSSLFVFFFSPLLLSHRDYEIDSLSQRTFFYAGSLYNVIITVDVLISALYFVSFRDVLWAVYK